MTDVAPEMEALVATVREALEHLCDCGTEVYDGPRREREAMSALERLRSLLLRAEENADGSQLLRELAETALRRAEEALRFIEQAMEEVLELDEPAAEVADVATSAARAVLDVVRAVLATPEETKEKL